MPRLTSRQKAIKEARKFSRLVLALNVVEDDDVDDGSESSNSTLEDVLLYAYARLNSLQNTRYYDRQSYRQSNYASSRYLADLHSGDVEQTGIAPWLNDIEFLRKYRMPRDAFWKLYDLIKEDEVFHPTRGSGRIQRPISFQLMVCLKAFGEEGSGSLASNLRDVFATGHGTSIVYIHRVVKAIRNIREKFLHWPDEDEKN